jgi:cytochrome c oxidase subunit 2
MANGSIQLADEAYIRDVILNPSQHVPAGYAPIMPTYKGQISEDGLISLVEYIKQLNTNYRVQQTQTTSVSDQAAPTTPGMVKP